MAELRSLLILCLPGLFAPAPVLCAQEPPYTPTSAYHRKTVAGFTVLIHPEVLEHRKEAGEALRELKAQLRKIVAVMPEKPLATLKKVRIWLEWEKKKTGAAEFHPSAVWLKENGYNPEKANCVELNNARNFVKWSRSDQPWMVLHELAHAYHFLVLGARHAGIESAYKNAVQEKLYEAVAHVKGGKKRKAYALTNTKEYFAELSEAYFGKNDFHPFARADLLKHDPVGYKVLAEVWGEPRNQPATPSRSACRGKP